MFMCFIYRQKKESYLGSLIYDYFYLFGLIKPSSFNRL